MLLENDSITIKEKTNELIFRSITLLQFDSLQSFGQFLN